MNPFASLTNDMVYGIPCIFIIGWRGEPGVKDEPQHAFQGKITLMLLEVLNIEYMIIDKNTTKSELESKMIEFKSLLDGGKNVAFVVKKGGLSYDERIMYKNNNSTLREEIIRHITKATKEDVIISTTGKTSRELFETRENNGQSHKYDFLTVGSMGYSSSIALGVAMNKTNKEVWCIDGDGAALMHMRAMAVILAKPPDNYIRVIINNGAHESVGGQPTVADSINLGQISLACGCKATYCTINLNELDEILSEIKDKQ